MRKDGVLGVKDFGAALLKAWVRRPSLERVVHPDVCLEGIRIREQAWATFEWALFLLVETLVFVSSSLALKLLTAGLVRTLEPIVCV